MKSRNIEFILLAALTSLFYITSSYAVDSPIRKTVSKQLIVAEKGFITPESIEYDPVHDIYLVSNINGSAIEAEGNGFISKVNPDGSIIELKWIDGTSPEVNLNSPKGMAILNGHLYVADINQVHIFDLDSGKQKKSITIKGSTFLNGITPGEGNYVYVTDSGLGQGPEIPPSTNGIYKVNANGSYSTIIKRKNMGRPNGIIVDNNQLTVVTFGSGEVYRVDKKGKQHALPKPPKGGLDGLLKLDDGRLLMSSWGESALYVLNNKGIYSILAGSLDAPADLGFDSKRQRILIPLFKQNKLVFLPLQ